jgi:hypothetical protein
MNHLILISPDQGCGFKPILSGKVIRSFRQGCLIYFSTY